MGISLPARPRWRSPLRPERYVMGARGSGTAQRELAAARERDAGPERHGRPVSIGARTRFAPIFGVGSGSMLGFDFDATARATDGARGDEVSGCKCGPRVRRPSRTRAPAGCAPSSAADCEPRTPSSALRAPLCELRAASVATRVPSSACRLSAAPRAALVRMSRPGSRCAPTARWVAMWEAPIEERATNLQLNREKRPPTRWRDEARRLDLLG